ncbi:zinc finger, CCHC-type containing protein [Tanacetum coccineum]
MKDTIGDKNPIRTLADYSKPSHEGYRNTIDLPEGNNVVPLQSDTIRTVKLRNDILMFQQHQGESLSEAWTHFKDLLQQVPHHGIDLWLQVQIFYDHVNPAIRRTIDQSVGGSPCQPRIDASIGQNPTDSHIEGKPPRRDSNLGPLACGNNIPKDTLGDLSLYDNESWNDLRDFAKPVKAISLS